MQQLESQVAYSFGRIETWLEEFAKQSQLHPSELKREIAGLLTNGTEPKRARIWQAVKHGQKVTSRRTAELNAQGLNAHGKPLSRTARGWGSMTAKQRSAEMIRRRRVAAGLESPRPRASQSKRPMGGVA